MRPFLGDLRLACRSLAKDRAFAVTAILTLGLGMTVFLTAAAVTRAYLLRDLPYPSAERLYWLRYAAPGLGEPREMERLDWASLGHIIEHPIAWDLDMFYLLGGEHAESVPGAWITPGFVEGLGVRPTIGRGLSPDAFLPGGVNEALISHRLWHTRFGAAPDVVGHTFTAYVSDRPEETEHFTIVGVLPDDFWHLNDYTAILAPLRAPTYPYMARLRPGVSPETAAARVTTLVSEGARNVPPGWTAQVVPVHEAYVARVRPTLRTVLAAGALVLLVACANVAALLLVRGSRRQKEVAIRAALGAGRGAIARMLVAEAVVLGTAATAVALFATSVTLDVLAPVVQQQIGRIAPGGAAAFSIDWRIALFAAAVGILTGLACSLAPLLTLIRPRLLTAMRSGNRASTDGRESGRFRSALIVLEIAATLALLVGATLMLRSVHALGQADLGISPERVLTGSMTLRQSRYPDAPSRLAVYEDILARLSGVPDAESVAFTTMWPLQQPRLQPIETARGERSSRVAIQGVSPEYFATLRIPIRSGRAFARADRDGSEPVVIVSETLARRLWPDGDSIGSRILVPVPHSGAGSPRISRVVVGIAADVRQGASDDDQADVYVPLLQEPGRFAFVLMRTSRPTEHGVTPFLSAIREVDPEIAVDRAIPMQELVGQMTAGSRFLAALLAALSAAAAALALVGVYSVIAYTVRQREREIAVRVAIGADPERIVRLFLRQGAVVLLTGLGLGVAGALAAGRLIESQLFGVTARDPLALGAAVIGFGAAALLATWWPARRAAATDPAIALRAE